MPNQVAEIKQAIRDARKADQLAEKTAVRTFEVFRSLKFSEPAGPSAAINRLDKAHEQVGEARYFLRDAVHQLETLLRQAGYSLPAKD